MDKGETLQWMEIVRRIAVSGSVRWAAQNSAAVTRL